MQHAVTRALSEAYDRATLLQEIRDTYAFRDILDTELDWVLEFVVHGGNSLRAYPDFHRVACIDGQYQVTDAKIARMHRMAIGTIAADMAMLVKYASGRVLGTVEENYLSRLKPGDCFQFAGKTLELMFLREGAAIVKRSKRQPNSTPRWSGGRMPLSSQLATEVRHSLAAAARGELRSTEMQRLEPIFRVQERWSAIPEKDRLLVESFRLRSTHYTCIYPFEGRLVHEGLSALVGWRYAQRHAVTLSVAVNDYGFLIQSNQPIELDEGEIRRLLAGQNLMDDLLQSLNTTELAKRQFREIARIAGLVHPGIPGQPKKARHLQASANMFFGVFEQYDSSNLLLLQARRELLENQFEFYRMRDALQRISENQLVCHRLKSPSPLAFPLVIEQIRQRLSSETLQARIRRLQAQLEAEADR